MTSVKLLVDFPEVIRQSEKLKSIDEKISYLLEVKRDAQILIVEAQESFNVNILGAKIDQRLLKLPQQIDIEIERLSSLKNLNTNISETKTVSSSSETSKSNLEQNNSTSSSLTVDAAAEYLQLSKSHIYKLTHTNAIRHSKPGGKKIYFEKKDLDDYAQSRKIKTSSDIEQEAILHIAKRKK